jgi:uracil-DNA glycosylase
MQDIATATSTAASLLSWWKEAGVDVLVDETTFPWLEGANPSNKMQARPKSSQRQDNAPLPATIPALISWLLNDPDIPEAGPPPRRIAASGNAGVPLMIIVEMPEANDHVAGKIFAGESAILFENMLKAIGVNRDGVYIVPLCPGRPATGQLPQAALPRLAEIARHHIALSVPKRLWLLGSTVSRALLGVDDVASVGNLHDFNHMIVNIPTVASFAPRFLLDNPTQKSRVWADMQVLVKGM